jgi:hypothetical protein
MTTVAQLAEAMQTLLTTTADATARATHFVQRRSKLTGATFVQALVFGWLANPQATVGARAQAAAVAGVAISPQGLEQRCTERGAIFLEQLLSVAVRTVIAAEPVALPLLQRFTAVVLQDSSTIVLPDALGPWWPGCGGSSPAHTAAALKLQVRFDLCCGTLSGPLLTDGRAHESTSPLQTAPLPPGSLRVADLGFFDLDVFAQMSAQGVYWLSRLLLATAVFTPQGSRCDVLSLLAAPGTRIVDLSVWGLHSIFPHVCLVCASLRRSAICAVAVCIATRNGGAARPVRRSWRGPNGPFSSPRLPQSCFLYLRPASWPVPAGRSSCSLNCGRVTASLMSRAVPSPGVSCATFSPSCWRCSSNIGSSSPAVGPFPIAAWSKPRRPCASTPFIWPAP